ncbi:MAG: hypothetical protein M1838_002761 [Thelocarpon superellum]|nr:MAG: hypothetical protein M1838_002761 [Thelocarpon superellum]
MASSSKHPAVPPTKRHLRSADTIRCIKGEEASIPTTAGRKDCQEPPAFTWLETFPSIESVAAGTDPVDAPGGRPQFVPPPNLEILRKQIQAAERRAAAERPRAIDKTTPLERAPVAGQAAMVQAAAGPIKTPPHPRAASRSPSRRSTPHIPEPSSSRLMHQAPGAPLRQSQRRPTWKIWPDVPAHTRPSKTAGKAKAPAGGPPLNPSLALTAGPPKKPGALHRLARFVCLRR